MQGLSKNSGGFISNADKSLDWSRANVSGHLSFELRERKCKFSARVYFLVRKLVIFAGSYLVQQNKLKSAADVFYFTI